MPSALLALLVVVVVLLGSAVVARVAVLPTYHRHKLERARAHIYALELELGLDPSDAPPRQRTVADRWKDGVSGKASNYTGGGGGGAGGAIIAIGAGGGGGGTGPSLPAGVEYRGITGNFVHCPRCRKTVPLRGTRCALCGHREKGWT